MKTFNEIAVEILRDNYDLSKIEISRECAESLGGISPDMNYVIGSEYERGVSVDVIDNADYLAKFFYENSDLHLLRMVVVCKDNRVIVTSPWQLISPKDNTFDFPPLGMALPINKI